MQAIIEINVADKTSKITGPIAPEILAMTAHFPWKKNDDDFYLNGQNEQFQSYKYNILIAFEEEYKITFEKELIPNTNTYRMNAVRDLLNDFIKSEFRNQEFFKNIEVLKKCLNNDISFKPALLFSQNNLHINFSFLIKGKVYSVKNPKLLELENLKKIFFNSSFLEENINNQNIIFTHEKINFDNYNITEHPDFDELKQFCRDKYADFYAWTKKLCLAESPLLDDLCMYAELKKTSIYSTLETILSAFIDKDRSIEKISKLAFDRNFKYYNIPVALGRFNYLTAFASNTNIQMEDIYFLDICFSALFFIENGIKPNKQKIQRFFDSYKFYLKMLNLKNYSSESINLTCNIFKKGSFRINADFNPDIKKLLNNLSKKMPNFQEPIENIRRKFILNSSVNENTFTFKNMLLNGSPGCGKTLFANEIAKMNNVSFEVLDFSTITTSFVLSGLDFSWRGGKPGKIFYILSNQPYFNPLILGDELDKSNGENQYGSPLNCLYTILEKGTAHKFKDEALDIEIDCSGLVWIFTSNGEHNIPKPIISRTNMYHVHDIEGDDKRMIVKNIYKALLNNAKWGELFDSELNEELIDIIVNYPNREIYTVLENACANAIEYRENNDNLIQLSLKNIVKHKGKPFGFI